MLRDRLQRLRTAWHNLSRRTRWFSMLGVVAAILIVVVRLLTAAHPEEPVARVLPVVRLQTIEDMAADTTIPFQGVLEPARAAVLVARAGGRVTAVRYQLGQNVAAGAVVVEIDGRGEANPGRAQVAGLTQSLALFDTNAAAARAAAQNGLTLAENNLKLAQATSPLQVEVAAVARQQADLAVRSTELALADAREGGSEALIRAADMAFQNASFAQDQATINRGLSTAQHKIAVPQAQLNVESARKSIATTTTSLAVARQQVATQLNVATEQLRLQQVSTPLAGEVTQLAVRVGDFVQPGSRVGEVNALAGATVRLAVPDGVANRLSPGQSISLQHASDSFTGVVAQVASAPASATGLWQVDIAIAATPQPIQAGAIVTARLPVGVAELGTYFLPLRALTIRHNGAVLFTMNAERRAVAHPVEVMAFSGALAHVRVSLAPAELIVVEGNRTIKEGDEVQVAQ